MKLKGLTHFSQDLSFCGSITDIGVLKFAEMLLQNQNLEQVFLSFYYCRQVTDISKESLISALSSLPRLKDVNLSIKNSKGISMTLAKKETQNVMLIESQA